MNLYTYYVSKSRQWMPLHCTLWVTEARWGLPLYPGTLNSLCARMPESCSLPFHKHLI